MNESTSPARTPTVDIEANAGAGSGRNGALDDAAKEALRERVIAMIKTCYDPEIPVNIYDLGLIYEVKVDDSAFVEVSMTLTSPMCPVAGSLPPEVETKVNAVEGVSGALVEVTWDPPWNPDMMSEEAKLELGF